MLLLQLFSAHEVWHLGWLSHWTVGGCHQSPEQLVRQRWGMLSHFVAADSPTAAVRGRAGPGLIVDLTDGKQSVMLQPTSSADCIETRDLFYQFACNSSLPASLSKVNCRLNASWSYWETPVMRLTEWSRKSIFQRYRVILHVERTERRVWWSGDTD